MEKKLKRSLALITVISILSASMIGCTRGKVADSQEPTGEKEPNTTKSDSEQTKEAGEKAEPVEIEVWNVNVGELPTEKGGTMYNYFKERIGVAPTMPAIPWNGGEAYLQRFRPAMAANDLPDMFLPHGGIEATIIENKAAVNLKDYLPKYAPNVWERIPAEIWDVIAAADPSGEGGIYYIPMIKDYVDHGAYIRQDWLDNLGLDMPKTRNQFVDVLKAFRDQDANKNGDPDDEIPTGGREGGSWMDHLFTPFGVAILAGKPGWEIYEGEITYAGVTKNMRSAIEFIRYLYQEKLMDQETFFNKKKEWDAKLYSDRVGIYYHMPEYAASRIEKMRNTNPNAEVKALPIFDVEGYDGVVSKKVLKRPEWMITADTQEKIIACLTLLNYLNDPENYVDLEYGAQGMHHVVKDGKKVMLEQDNTKMECRFRSNIISEKQIVNRMDESKTEEDAWKWDMVKNLILDTNAQPTILSAANGMPSSVYGDYADIRSHTMYKEYMTRIVIGEWSIDKFDEFVEKWHKSGGEEVTKNVRKWYAAVKK